MRRATVAMTEPSVRDHAPPPGAELTLTRVFDAPPALLFRVWTEPALVQQWWGPEGFTITACEMDVRVGGRYRTCKVSPEGTEHWQTGVYREISPVERLEFTYAWEDEHGDPKHVMLITVRFEALGEKTRLTLVQRGLESETARTAHLSGWESTFRRLDGELPHLLEGIS
jgi:uncharacterized protein YndB with AHSA1/START domain